MAKIVGIILFLLVISASSFIAYTQYRAPRIATPPEGNFIEIDGSSVHYVERGQGPALILIHGAGGSSREWTFSMMDELTDRYRVIAIDRAGHGYSSRIKTRANAAETLAEQAEHVARLAGQLNIETAIITGQSYGGGVAMALAVNHPELVSALVMVAGVSNPWEGDLDPWYQKTNTWWGKYLMIPVLSNLTTQERARDITKGIFAPDPVPEGYLDHVGLRLSAQTSQIRANTGQINRSLEDVKAMVGEYGKIDVPLEIIHGDQDTTVPLKTHAIPLSGQIDGAVLTVLEGTGHMPHHTREQDVIDAIDRAAKRAGLQ